MGDGNASGGMEAEQERERRLEALRQIAGEQGGTTRVVTLEPSMVSGVRGARRTVWVIGLVALLVCVVVAGAAVYVTHRGAPRTTASPIQRVTMSDGDLGCVFGARYSPDGKMLAVLAGPALGCNSTQGQGSYPTSLILYDVATMKPTRTIELEKAALAKAQAPAGEHVLSIGLFTPFWSADSQRVAVTLGGPLAPLGSPQPGQDYWNGMAIIQTSTQAIQVISASSEPVYPSNPPISPSSYTPTWAWLINIAAGTMKPVRVSQALAYQWQPDDSVTVQTPMPASPEAPPAVPTDGPLSPYGTTIDMWQGASVSYQAYPCAPPYYQLRLGGTLAWSPDGNAIFEPGFAVARLTVAAPMVPTPTAIPGASLAPCTPDLLSQFPTAEHLAVVAPRDPGMREALRVIKANADNSSQFDVDGLAILWSPDGKRAAVTPDSISGSVQGAVMPYVAIYDSASGRQLAQYSATKLDPLYKAGSDEALFLNTTWSPDGKTLLVADNSTIILIRV